ncbi:GAF domain-containing protein, partial [Vibrio vulnificus]|nr:GAF domain-containing protein [Vibrio vulnificus]
MTIEHYQTLTKQAVALIESERDLIANLSNISALLNMGMS